MLSSSLCVHKGSQGAPSQLAPVSELKDRTESWDVLISVWNCGELGDTTDDPYRTHKYLHPAKPPSLLLLRKPLEEIYAQEKRTNQKPSTTLL